MRPHHRTRAQIFFPAAPRTGPGDDDATTLLVPQYAHVLFPPSGSLPGPKPLAGVTANGTVMMPAVPFPVSKEAAAREEVAPEFLLDLRAASDVEVARHRTLRRSQGIAITEPSTSPQLQQTTVWEPTELLPMQHWEQVPPAVGPPSCQPPPPPSVLETAAAAAPPPVARRSKVPAAILLALSATTLLIGGVGALTYVAMRNGHLAGAVSTSAVTAMD